MAISGQGLVRGLVQGAVGRQPAAGRLGGRGARWGRAFSRLRAPAWRGARRLGEGASRC